MGNLSVVMCWILVASLLTLMGYTWSNANRKGVIARRRRSSLSTPWAASKVFVVTIHALLLHDGDQDTEQTLHRG
jgi:hypothetical protein